MAHIESGDFFANVAEPGWLLHEGEGQRTHVSAIRFGGGFTKEPLVVLGVTGLDTEKHTDTRFNVSAHHVNREGFDLCIRTWGDTAVLAIEVNWLAHGE
jgi:hypothetical protein